MSPIWVSFQRKNKLSAIFSKANIQLLLAKNSKTYPYRPSDARGLLK